jgi:hypothetical protein
VQLVVRGRCEGDSVVKRAYDDYECLLVEQTDGLAGEGDRPVSTACPTTPSILSARP